MTMRQVAEGIINARKGLLDYVHMAEHLPRPVLDLLGGVFISTSARYSTQATRDLGELKGWGRLRTTFMGSRIILRKAEEGVLNRVKRVGACPGQHEYASGGLAEIEDFLKGDEG